jgi:hypothetical protein
VEDRLQVHLRRFAPTADERVEVVLAVLLVVRPEVVEARDGVDAGLPELRRDHLHDGAPERGPLVRLQLEAKRLPVLLADPVSVLVDPAGLVEELSGRGRVVVEMLDAGIVRPERRGDRAVRRPPRRRGQRLDDRAAVDRKRQRAAHADVIERLAAQVPAHEGVGQVRRAHDAHVVAPGQALRRFFGDVRHDVHASRDDFVDKRFHVREDPEHDLVEEGERCFDV